MDSGCYPQVVVMVMSLSRVGLCVSNSALHVEAADGLDASGLAQFPLVSRG